MAQERPLSTALRDALGDRGGSLSASPQLEATLEVLLDRAYQAWPGIALARAVLLAFVAQRLPEPTLEDLERLHWSDLLVASGCALGDATALGVFESEFMPAVTEAAARMDLRHNELDDVRQVIRQQILVEGRIADYAGRGPLKSWLRVAAMRASFKLGRKGKREVATDDDTLLVDQTSYVDPELLLMRETYRSAFRDAFQAALEELSDRDKLLLRQHIVDGLTVDDLGQMYEVHRATAARWVSKARERLVSDTRRHFLLSAKITPTECDSILRLVSTQLEATIRRRMQA